MPIEIEAKVSVPDVEVVRKRLREVGAEPAGSVIETNTFFDTDDRSLLAADKGLRLRKKVNASDASDVKFIITFKGPRRHGQLKSREEVELGVEGEREAMSLLSCLGYSRILSFEKRRESWKLGGCHVELDELPHLGTYVEIDRGQVSLGPGHRGLSMYSSVNSAHRPSASKRIRKQLSNVRVTGPSGWSW